MKKVLVVDDLPEVRLVIRTIIENDGVEVFEAGDGLEALQVLRQDEVDLIITDCQMPQMTGLELIKAAREEIPDVPFIVVSSTAQEEDFRPFRPRAIMGKPFKLLELKSEVDRALGHKR